MNAKELGVFIGRINAARTVPDLTKIAAELQSDSFAADNGVEQLLALVMEKRKRIERLN